MKRLEELLLLSVLVRVHHPAIVNRHRVTEMRPHRNGKCFPPLGKETELELSRTYQANLERLAERLQFRRLRPRCFQYAADRLIVRTGSGEKIIRHSNIANLGAARNAVGSGRSGRIAAARPDAAGEKAG